MKRLILLLIPLAAVCCGKNGEGEEDFPERLLAPVNVVLHDATETSLTFQWDMVVGATAYDWLLTCDGAEFKTGIVAKRNVTIEGLSKGTTYGFSVCATADGGNPASASPYSEEIMAVTAGIPTDPHAVKVCVDAPLVLELDSAPTLGTSGLIKVFTSSGKEVDRINLADIATVNVRSDGVMLPKEQITAATERNTFMDVLSSSGRTRTVHYTPLQVKGKTLVIKLHSGVLDFDGDYYVTVDESVCGKAVAAGEWEFSTASAPSTTEISVAADGSGDFCTLQRALMHAADGAVITLAKGTYPELLYLREKKNITVKGSSRDDVRIAYPNSESYMNGSSARCMWLVENCDNLVIRDLTIENTFGDQKGQAETIYFNSGSNAHKLTVDNCSLISLQDTFLCKGEVWVHNSLIAGHCDYIWGYPKACLFENCEIRSRAAGYVVQARVPAESLKGFVFLNCSFTAESGVKDGSMYIARSAGQPDCFDNVVLVSCTLHPVIRTEGWLGNPAPNPSTPTATSGWREYGSVNPSGNPVTGHNSFGKVLTAEEAAPYSSKEAVLGW